MGIFDRIRVRGSSRPRGGDETTARDMIDGLRLGERQVSGPLVVYPVFSAEGGAGGEESTPPYLALGQALQLGVVRITEVSKLGSVPEVRVDNRGERPVLMLDGEELRGAKQNRVVSTTVLVEAGKTLIVPVVCSEQGRWAYLSNTLADSEVLADRRVRWALRTSVLASLRRGDGARADQGRVWTEIEILLARQATESRTGAMRDAYERRKDDLDRLLAAFPLQPGQNGLLVMHGARVVGLDLVSRAAQYAALHDRLLRSYVFEALIRSGEPGEDRVAADFLERVAHLRGERFDGVGLGHDVRYEGDGVSGSVLVCDGHVVHAAFFDYGGARGSWGDQPREEPSGRRRADYGGGATPYGDRAETGDAAPELVRS